MARIYARIENNRVVEIFDLDEHHPDRTGIDGLFHPSLDWRSAPADCAEGWVVFDNQLVAPDAQVISREAAKAARAAAVAAITVTTAAGHTFDGDETSQGRMARSILAMQATGTPTVRWVLADNSVIDATAAELTEALALAGAAQAAIWVINND